MSQFWDWFNWRAPIVMILSVLLGTVFAIGHDRFYQHFDGREVSSSLQQKVIINVGTAFAFLVNLTFCIAVGTVFVQQIFVSLRRKATHINDIDSIFNVMVNVWEFTKVKLWFRHWALLVIAIVVWTLPIAAVFTPGTIQVNFGLKYDNSTVLRPAQPQQSWRGKQSFANTQIDYTAIFRVGAYTYASLLLNSPSGILSSVAAGSASRRNVLPIPAPDQNSSYGLTFYGPSLGCVVTPQEELATFYAALVDARKTRGLPGLSTILESVESAYDYDSYVLKYNSWMKDSIYGYNLSHPSWNNDSSNYFPFPYSDNTGFFYFNTSGHDTLIECHLHNATYDVGFTFQNSEQTINVNSVTLHELFPFNETTIIDVNNTDISNAINYDNAVFSAVQYAFNDIVVGAASNETGGGSVNNGVQYYQGLASLSVLRDFIESEEPIEPSVMVAAIQTMFQNITISTLSAPQLRLTNAQASPITGTTWRTVNIYQYQPTDLYIAYGCSLLATVFCVFWGFYVISHYNHHRSYSLKFSTILRTTRRREFDNVVDATARNGADPVPRRIKEPKLRYSVGDGEDGHLDGFELVGGFATGAEYKGERPQAKADIGEEDTRHTTEARTVIPQYTSPVSPHGQMNQIKRKPLQT